jgi:hypothetical protein
MANTKITSMVAHHYRQLKAETQDDIATAPFGGRGRAQRHPGPA